MIEKLGHNLIAGSEAVVDRGVHVTGLEELSVSAGAANYLDAGERHPAAGWT